MEEMRIIFTRNLLCRVNMKFTKRKCKYNLIYFDWSDLAAIHRSSDDSRQHRHTGIFMASED